MPFAVDFGAANTVVAYLTAASPTIKLLDCATLSTTFPEAEDLLVPIIPSQISYFQGGVYYGQEVIESGLEGHAASFRWMKPQLLRGKDSPRIIGNTSIGYVRASTDYLLKILNVTGSYLDLQTEPTAFPIPIEAFETYQKWLDSLCARMNITNYRYLDEATACLLGYETQVCQDDAFMILDFGAGSLDVSIVRVENPKTEVRACKVLGKAGCDIGGMDLDRWLLQDAIKRYRLADNYIKKCGGWLLHKLEKAKIILSLGDEEVTIDGKSVHLAHDLRFNRSQVTSLLEQNQLKQRIYETIDSALGNAARTDFNLSALQKVLPVGGTSLLPYVRAVIHDRFGDKVLSNPHPISAVVRGACRYAAGARLSDHIQHDYALRHYNSRTKSYEFLPLIERGTVYPTPDNYRSFIIKGTFEGQTVMGLEVYEVAQTSSARAKTPEVVFSPTGDLTFGSGVLEVDERYIQLNPDNPLFLTCNPPSYKGEKRFRVSFMVDRDKRLLLSATDLYHEHEPDSPRKRPYHNIPVIKLV